MDHEQIKKIFIDFYKSKGHKQVPDASLIPEEHDPSALFTNSGMHPLKSYFLGVQKPPTKRIVNVQKCIRTGDIEEVGDNRHLTFFHMLGNWSIGDYWKDEAIPWAYELLTKHYKMDPKKLWAAIFKGDRKLGLGVDRESADIWTSTGIPKSRQVLQSASELFWAVGATGPCGPTSEVYYDLGPKAGKTFDERYMEIWNPLVQIAYNKDEKGKLVPLKIRSLDGGAGFERIVAILQGKDDIFLTTIFQPLIKRIEKYSGKTYSRNKKAFRIVADHVRASVFITAEGINPGKKEREYVLRRILRRLIRYANSLGIQKAQIGFLLDLVIDQYKKEYPYLNKKRAMIHRTIGQEYDRFIKTLNKGNRLFNKLVADLKKHKQKVIPGKNVFNLYDTYGFPLELTAELAKEHGFKIDEKGYKKHFAKHQEVSKRGQTQKFSGGLSDSSERVTQYHTVNHLLQAALQKVLGSEVQQRGSNLTAERLRYDFSWPEKLTDEQKKKTEVLVNKWIKQKLLVKMEEMSLAAAKKAGAQGVFEHKYGSKVKVYSVGTVSKELCGGPHVKNTSEIKGTFRIKKEKSVSAGVRRIKAVLE